MGLLCRSPIMLHEISVKVNESDGLKDEQVYSHIIGVIW